MKILNKAGIKGFDDLSKETIKSLQSAFNVGCKIFCDRKGEIDILIVSVLHQGKQTKESFIGKNEALGYFSNIVVLKIDKDINDFSAFLIGVSDMFTNSAIMSVNLITDYKVFISEPPNNKNELIFEELYSFKYVADDDIFKTLIELKHDEALIPLSEKSKKEINNHVESFKTFTKIMNELIGEKK